MGRRRSPFFLALALSGFAITLHAQKAELTWAGDPEGGAPFVEADPADPNKLTGFDVEIAELIARGLKRTPHFLFVPYGSIDQAIERGTAEIGLSGMEDTSARRAAMATTIPYYAFNEVLAVRDGDAGALRGLGDFRGRRVGTLGGTLAYEILLQGEGRYGLQAVSYDDDVHPYSDLLLGRVDGVLLDNVLAERRRKNMPGFTVQPAAVAQSHYVGVLAARNAPLRDVVDEILRGAMRDGSLERIFRKWSVWNDDQPALYASLIARKSVPAVSIAGSAAEIGVATLSRQEATLRYIPSLVKADQSVRWSVVLLPAVAVSLGVAIASRRVYGTGPVRLALTGYVELMRGTRCSSALFMIAGSRRS
jgi:polar amino acid transport system substrate-binding protein